MQLCKDVLNVYVYFSIRSVFAIISFNIAVNKILLNKYFSTSVSLFSFACYNY